MDKTKRCFDCKQVKPVEDFSKDKSRKDGLSYKCRKCNTKRAKTWNNKNKERYNANRMRAYYGKTKNVSSV